MARKALYESKATISKITATSRASLKVKDSYFTVEYSEERIIPDIDGVSIKDERTLLWDTVNAEVDNQCEQIIKSFK